MPRQSSSHRRTGRSISRRPIRLALLLLWMSCCTVTVAANAGWRREATGHDTLAPPPAMAPTTTGTSNMLPGETPCDITTRNNNNNNHNMQPSPALQEDTTTSRIIRKLQVIIPGLGTGTVRPPEEDEEEPATTTLPPVEEEEEPATATTTTLPPIVDTGDFIYFQLDFGFEAGQDSNPTLPEIDGLTCVCLEWIEDRVDAQGFSLFRRHLGSSSSSRDLQIGGSGADQQVTAYAYHIDWIYTEGAQLPLKLRFHADVRMQDEEESPVLGELVFKAFDLTQDEIAAFITNYVWNLPESNVFFYTNRLDYRVRKDEPFPSQEQETTNPDYATQFLERSVCEEDETRAPTVSPAETAAPMGTDAPLGTTTDAPTFSPPTSAPETPEPTLEAPEEEEKEEEKEEPTETEAPAQEESQPPVVTPGLGVPAFTSAPGPVTTTPPASTPTPETPVDATQKPTAAPDTPETTTSTSSPQPPPETGSPPATETPTLPPTTLQPTSPGFTSLPEQPVSFLMTFEWDNPEYTDREPNKQDVQEVMCKFRIYLQDRLEIATSTDTEIKVDVTNLDWVHSGVLEDGTSNLRLNLTASAMYTTTLSEEPVPPEVVVASLYERNEDVLTFLHIPSIPAAEADRPPTDEDGNVVFGDRDDFLFAHAISVVYQDYPLGTELESGSLRSIGCGERIFDQPERSILGEPLDLDNLPEPPEEVAEEEPTVAENNEGTPEETESPMDTPVTPADPNSPVESPAASPGGSSTEAPTMSSLQPETASQQQPTGRVAVSFIVSNLISMTVPAEVNRSGIADAFPVFADRLVSGLVALQAPSVPSTRRHLLRQKQRRLEVQVVPGSAFIGSLIRTQCGENAHPDLICHEAEAFYELEDRDGNTTSVVDGSLYTSETYRAINDGTLYSVMNQVTPDTPLFIGTVLPPTSDSSSSNTIILWVLVGVTAFLLLCMFCLCWYILYQRRLYEDELEYERALTDDIVDETDKLGAVDHHHHYPPGAIGGSADRTAPMVDDDDGEEGFLDEDEGDAFVDSYIDGDDDNEAQLLALADAGFSDDNEAQLLALATADNEKAGFDDDNEARLLALAGAENSVEAPATAARGVEEKDASGNAPETTVDDSDSEDEEGLDWEAYDATNTTQREFPIAPAASLSLQNDNDDNDSSEEEDVNWEEYGGDELLASASAAGLASIPMVEELLQLSSSSDDGDVNWEEYGGDVSSTVATTEAAQGSVKNKSSSSSEENVDWEDHGGVAGDTASTLDNLDLDSSSDPEGVDWEVYE